MGKQKYRMKAACPQCGCSFLQVMTPDEIREKYGDVPNVELECHECMTRYTEEMKTVCPEWDAECRLKE